MKRINLIAAAAALSVGIVLAGVVPAQAADHKGANRSCVGVWTWSGVTSTASTVHQHEANGWWNKNTYGSGSSAHRGLFNPGAALLEANTSGHFSSWAFGCQ
ncbi:MAG TPA: hypothetical protein VNJ54_04810 [Plantibacter sp.]|uniref:hypothetical protein n=1 Tax=unclassified Plantibacter TaxID=2624265 RepID=UPI002CD119D9|nr:hypothetical protein [Plantibacter sp.]